MNEKNGIDKMFQQSFEDFVDTPSDVVWAGLEGQLVGNNKQIHRITYYKRSLVLALFLVFILSTVLVGFYFENNNSIDNSLNITSSNSPNQNTNEGNLVISELDQEINLVNSEDIKTNTSISTTSSINNSESTKKEQGEGIKPMVLSDSKPKSSLEMNEIKLTGFSTNRKSENLNRNNIRSNQTTTQTTTIRNQKQHDIPHNIEVFNNNTLVEISNLETINIGLLVVKNVADIKIKEPFIVLKSTLCGFNRWSISPYLRYGITGRNIKGATEETKFFDLHESNSSAFSYGLDLDYNFNHLWSFKLGLGLDKIGISSNTDVSSIYQGEHKLQSMVFTSFNTNNIQMELNNRDNLQKGDIVNISGVFHQETTWLQIPMMVGYHYNKYKWSLDVYSGISANIFLSDNLKFEDTQNQISSFTHTFSEQSAKTYISYTGEVNIHFRPKNKLDLYMGMYYKKALTSANKNKNVQFSPYSYGLQLGSKIFL